MRVVYAGPVMFPAAVDRDAFGNVQSQRLAKSAKLIAIKRRTRGAPDT